MLKPFSFAVYGGLKSLSMPQAYLQFLKLYSARNKDSGPYKKLEIACVAATCRLSRLRKGNYTCFCIFARDVSLKPKSNFGDKSSTAVVVVRRRTWIKGKHYECTFRRVQISNCTPLGRVSLEINSGSIILLETIPDDLCLSTTSNLN